VGIADLQQGCGYDGTLQYDGNQRLRAAGPASFGGDHWHRYSYDADNLISASLGGVKDHRHWYDAHNRLTNILDGSGATVTASPRKRRVQPRTRPRWAKNSASRQGTTSDHEGSVTTCGPMSNERC